MNSLKQRLRKGAACLGAMTVIAVVPLAMLAEPASAAWPATIKICNNTESTDTNGAATDGKNFDVERLAGSSYGTYNNELLPGDCTGNVNDPANVRIDLTDDGVNFVPDGSAMIGIDADGIDDSQGAWDMPCVDSVTATNEAALPLQQTMTEHVPAGGAVKVRVRAARNCGAGLSDHVRTCNAAGSTKTFDVFKTDGSYNNELPPGECTNWKDADGNNPLRADLADDGANTVMEWKVNSDGGTWSACERETAVTGMYVPSTTDNEDYTLTDHTTDDGSTTIIHATRNIQTYNDGTAGSTLCGVSVASGTNSIGAQPDETNPTTGQFVNMPPVSGDDPTAADPGPLADEAGMTDQQLVAQEDDVS